MATTGLPANEFYAEGTISSADITDTAVGKLGHANGVVLVPAYGAGKAVELISALLILEFDTAAYTGGGNTSINISGGGAVLTGVATAAQFIQQGADIMIQLVPLATTYLTLTDNKGLALVSASAPTGTGKGEIHYRVSYRVHTNQL